MSAGFVGASMLVGTALAVVGLAAAAAAPSPSTVRLGVYGLGVLASVIALLLLVSAGR